MWLIDHYKEIKDLNNPTGEKMKMRQKRKLVRRAVAAAW